MAVSSCPRKSVRTRQVYSNTPSEYCPRILQRKTPWARSGGFVITTGRLVYSFQLHKFVRSFFSFWNYINLLASTVSWSEQQCRWEETQIYFSNLLPGWFPLLCLCRSIRMDREVFPKCPLLATCHLMDVCSGLLCQLFCLDRILLIFDNVST